MGGKSLYLGFAAYAFAESTIDGLITQFAGSFNLPVNMIELALGYYLKKRSDIIGSVGTAMFWINFYEVIKGFTGTGFNLLMPNATATTNNIIG